MEKDETNTITEAAVLGLGMIKELINTVKSLPLRKDLSQELTYEDAMKYFIAHQNDSPKIAKGAILKETINDGVRIIQVFLDKENNLVEDEKGNPLGCKTEVQRIDNELAALFKDHDLVIVE